MYVCICVCVRFCCYNNNIVLRRHTAWDSLAIDRIIIIMLYVFDIKIYKVYSSKVYMDDAVECRKVGEPHVWGFIPRNAAQSSFTFTKNVSLQLTIAQCLYRAYASNNICKSFSLLFKFDYRKIILSLLFRLKKKRTLVMRP
jgi:hypothetical protein